MGLVPFIVFLLIAMVMGFTHEFFHPRSCPGGLPAAITVAFFGAWIGSAMMWHVGPDYEGIPLLATVAMSGISLFFFSLVSGGQSRAWE
jgi:uncharacterized membrane protein YeaQ/YmgE (transglycosylase-associated protein family)